MREPTYLHVCPDDKAIRHLRSIYTPALPGRHRFIVSETSQAFLHGASESRGPHHMVLTPDDKFVDSGYWASPELIEDCREADVVFLHSLHGFAAPILEHVRDNAIVIWNAWGGDVYSRLPEFAENRLLLPLTIAACNRLEMPPLCPAKQLRGHLGRLKQRLQKLKALARPASDEETFRWSRIDLYSGPYHRRLLEVLPGFRAEPLRLGWYASETLCRGRSAGGTGDDIQIGHAAWPMDNHLEAIAMLARFDLSDRSVILPLNYGGREYGDVVDSTAQAMLSAKVVSLRTWLSLDEYTRIASQCGHLILNSIRTVGFGSVIPHLCCGGRLFVRRQCSLGVTLRSLGICVNDVEDLDRDGRAVLKPLESTLQEQNRRCVDLEWGLTAVQARIARIYAYWRVRHLGIRCKSRQGLWGN